MADSVIQATGAVEFEDCLWIGNHLLEIACRGSALHLGFNHGRCAHLGSSRGRLNPNLLGFVWLLGVKQVTGFDSWQPLCLH